MKLTVDLWFELPNSEAGFETFLAGLRALVAEYWLAHYPG